MAPQKRPKGDLMSKKRKSPEQIVRILREMEVSLATGLTVAQAIEDHGVTENTYYRWKRQYGAMDTDEVRRLRELEAENARLKKLVADLSLDKDILQEALRKKH